MPVRLPAGVGGGWILAGELHRPQPHGDALGAATGRLHHAADLHTGDELARRLLSGGAGRAVATGRVTAAAARVVGAGQHLGGLGVGLLLRGLGAGQIQLAGHGDAAAEHARPEAQQHHQRGGLAADGGDEAVLHEREHGVGGGAVALGLDPHHDVPFVAAAVGRAADHQRQRGLAAGRHRHRADEDGAARLGPSPVVGGGPHRQGAGSVRLVDGVHRGARPEAAPAVGGLGPHLQALGRTGGGIEGQQAGVAVGVGQLDRQGALRGPTGGGHHQILVDPHLGPGGDLEHAQTGDVVVVDADPAGPDHERGVAGVVDAQLDAHLFTRARHHAGRFQRGAPDTSRRDHHQQ
ncbi:MAG: hypothetical protein R2749_15150 [Acidimicrobiales bacterium]